MVTDVYIYIYIIFKTFNLSSLHVLLFLKGSGCHSLLRLQLLVVPLNTSSFKKEMHNGYYYYSIITMQSAVLWHMNIMIYYIMFYVWRTQSNNFSYHILSHTVFSAHVQAPRASRTLALASQRVLQTLLTVSREQVIEDMELEQEQFQHVPTSFHSKTGSKTVVLCCFFTYFEFAESFLLFTASCFLSMFGVMFVGPTTSTWLSRFFCWSSSLAGSLKNGSRTGLGILGVADRWSVWVSTHILEMFGVS